jgi:hypothetical protein
VKVVEADALFESFNVSNVIVSAMKRRDYPGSDIGSPVREVV